MDIITQVATHKILGVRRPFSLKGIDTPQAQSGRLCYKGGNFRYYSAFFCY